MTVLVQCNVCEMEFSIEVPEAGYKAWEEGMLIQRAMPDVPKGERELLISSVCESCFDKMFKE